MHSWSIPSSLILVFALSACGSSNFTGEAGGRAGADRTAGGNTDVPVSTTHSPSKTDDRPNDSSDDQAIAKCLAKFGSHPFGAGQDYRKISASVQVLGFGKGIVDDEVTSAPKLILISATVNVLGSTTYELNNPNGWYCLQVDVNVKADTTIKLQCDAKIADNKVNVAVGGNAAPTGRVGVHVLSDINIERTGACTE